jgi:hypothetical protein
MLSIRLHSPLRGHLSRVLAVAAAFLFLVVAAPAFSVAPDDDAGWKWEIELEAEGEYDSNVFNQSDAGKDRIRDQDPVDQQNGRIRDMDSVDDFIISPNLEIGVSRKNSLGRFSIAPSAAYHRFIENDERSYPEVGLRIRQTLPQKSAVELKASYDFDVFKKNYLEGTIGTGVIDDDERIYARGIYDDLDIDLGYERRLWRTDSKRRKDRYAWATMLTGEIHAIYSMRNYEGFSNRDLDIYGGELVFTTAFGERLGVEVGYTYLRYDAPGKSEVTIIDEPDVGVDLDGDGNADDDNVRSVNNVDRTRNQHEVGVKVKLDVTRDLRFWVGYEYILRDYVSDYFLDIAHRDREDDHHTAEAGIRWKFAKKWALDLEGGYTNRSANKPASLLDEEDGLKEGGMARLAITRTFSF